MPITQLCELLDIEHPILQGPLGPWSTVDLAATVSAAGGLGLVGTAMRSVEALREDVSLFRELTDRPFAIDLTQAPVDDELLLAALDVRPKAIALPADDAAPHHVARACAAGIVAAQYASSARHAALAVEAGASVIACSPERVAYISEVMAPVPVVAAGSISEGLEIAAAMTLGAQGVAVGRHLLAAPEAGMPDAGTESAADIVRDMAEEAEHSLGMISRAVAA